MPRRQSDTLVHALCTYFVTPCAQVQMDLWIEVIPRSHHTCNHCIALIALLASSKLSRGALLHHTGNKSTQRMKRIACNTDALLLHHARCDEWTRQSIATSPTRCPGDDVPQGEQHRRHLALHLALVASYVAVLLLVNVCTTTAVAIGMIYARRGQGLSHYYLGEGLLAILRCCLGTIEAASGLFRSVSLSLRTACNAVAGHVLLAVLIDMTLATCCTGSTTYRVHL